MTDRALVRSLFEGPLDIVGDIHGEIDALRSVMSALEYRADGTHPGGRRLVFVGDLCDRGPDSPAVIDLVQGMVERELAQCVLGNHELNILRGAAKHGNRWFIDPEHEEQRDEFADSKPAPNQPSKQRWATFFQTLPVALERPDLRVVHAAWNTTSIEELRPVQESAFTLFQRFESAAKQHLEQSGLAAEARAEKHAHVLDDSARQPPLLKKLGLHDAEKQWMNPLQVITSGLERLTDKPFWANGRWRMCERVKWWDEYLDTTPVIFGHYWRGTPDGDDDVSGGKPDLFDGYQPDQWAGPHDNLFCVDFSVGRRYRERRRNAASFTTRLAAVRWPEREIVFDS